MHYDLDELREALLTGIRRTGIPPGAHHAVAGLDALVAVVRAADEALVDLTEEHNGHTRGSVGFTITDPNARAYVEIVCRVINRLREALAPFRKEKP